MDNSYSIGIDAHGSDGLAAPIPDLLPKNRKAMKWSKFARKKRQAKANSTVNEILTELD